MEFPIRINKYLADKGYTTRRGADTLIDAGKVLINGKKALLGQQVQKSDKVTVSLPEKTLYRYFLYYKPRGVITHSPNESETDIRMQIEHDYGITGVFPVGRLDKDSEGLILLTNDGRVTKRLLEPQYDHEKEYYVVVDKIVTQSFISRIERGINIEGYMTKSAKAVRDPRNEHAVSITLTEGKKHQIRRMCAALGYHVERLKRTRVLMFTLRPLKEGGIREMNSAERKKLLGTLALLT
jgi:23S rRNA pseudouridine2604 synthase